MGKEYLSLDKLEAYLTARELSRSAWDVYQLLGWEDRKTMGNQFLEATDSVGANIAEGFGRFHFLDKAKFYYNARASLLESKHWLGLLAERGKTSSPHKEKFLNHYKNLRPCLAGLINSVVEAKNEKS